MSAGSASPDATLTLADIAYRTTFWAQLVRVLCKIAGVVVLARLVSPADHGLFAMAASVTFILVLLRDLGTSTAAIQSPTLSEEQKTTLAWLNVGGGIVLALIGAALSPLAAVFFHEPAVAPLLVALSASFLLTGLNAWPRTLLSRELRYREVNLIETAGAVLGTIAMVTAGALGAGAYAFAAFLLVSEATMIVAWRFCRWRAAAPVRWGSAAGLVGTGWQITRANLLVAAAQQLDAFLFGRWFGAAPLGLYNRAGQVLQQPMMHLATPFSQVLLATLSRLGPQSPEFPRHLRETANLIGYLTLPLAALAFAIPHEIVAVVLGSAWPDAAPLLRWLALGAAAIYLGAPANQVAIAGGRAERLTHLTAASLAVLTTGLFLARSFGPVGLSAAVGMANVLLLVPKLWWTSAGTSVRLRDYADAFTGPLLFAGLLAAGAATGRALVDTSPTPARFAAALAGTALAGLVGGLAIPRLRAEIRAVARRGISPRR